MPDRTMLDLDDLFVMNARILMQRAKQDALIERVRAKLAGINYSTLTAAELSYSINELIAMWRGEDMPLKTSASPKAFTSNVKAEVKAGKKPQQAVAIAYAKKREAEAKGKK